MPIYKIAINDSDNDKCELESGTGRVYLVPTGTTTTSTTISSCNQISLTFVSSYDPAGACIATNYSAYEIDTPQLADATVVYDNCSSLIVAANGTYSDGTTYVHQLSGSIVETGLCSSITTTTTTTVASTTPTLTSDNITIETSFVTSISVTTAAGASIGDILFLFVACSNNTTITDPSGWTVIKKVQSNSPYESIGIYYKIATSSDLSPAITTITFGTGNRCMLLKSSFLGKSSSPYFDTVTSSNYFAVNDGTSISPSLSTGIENSLLISFSSVITNLAGVTYSSTWTDVDGVNIGNNQHYRQLIKRQSTNGTTETLDIDAAGTADLQDLLIQLLPY